MGGGGGTCPMALPPLGEARLLEGGEAGECMSYGIWRWGRGGRGCDIIIIIVI